MGKRLSRPLVVAFPEWWQLFAPAHANNVSAVLGRSGMESQYAVKVDFYFCGYNFGDRTLCTENNMVFWQPVQSEQDAELMA